MKHLLKIASIVAQEKLNKSEIQAVSEVGKSLEHISQKAPEMHAKKPVMPEILSAVS